MSILSNNQFIKVVGQLAQNDYPTYKILPSLTIAQAILESAWGKSVLTQEANNLFGIKKGSSWTGEVYNIKTAEYDANNQKYYITASFRKYKNWQESVWDHNKLLQNERYTRVKGETNYKLACQYIKDAGYATDPSYPSKLINLIETYNLNEYDSVVNNNQQSSDNNTITSSHTISYIIKSGDTLNKIASKYNTTVSAIVKLNNINNPNLIITGKTIQIPVKQEYISYVIKSGDTLGEIALRYNTTVSEIAKLNNINNPNLIYPNEVIKIPKR